MKTKAKIYLSEEVYKILNVRLNGGLNDLSVYFIRENNRYDFNDLLSSQ